MSRPSDRLDTKLIHQDRKPEAARRSALVPIYTSTVWEFGGGDEPTELRYPRLNNTPNQERLGAKLAALEGVDGGIVTGSGLAAISTALLGVVPHGGHVIAHAGLYGGVMAFLENDFPGFGREVTFVDSQNPAEWKAALKPNTKAIYGEALSNPLLEIGDLAAVVRFAREHDLVSLVDNTIPSPLGFQPLRLGFDVSLHSATKYLNGHSDLVAGCILGRRETIAPIEKLATHLGATLDAHACYLFDRGLKTLGVRVRHQNATAQKLAEFLETHPGIARVRYPGLASHPQHARAKELFHGFGGMLCFDVKGDAKRTDAALAKLRLFFNGPSFGGLESLVTRPAITSHSWISPDSRAKLGILDSTVRLSVGLEDPADLVEDLDQAFR